MLGGVLWVHMMMGVLGAAMERVQGLKMGPKKFDNVEESTQT